MVKIYWKSVPQSFSLYFYAKNEIEYIFNSVDHVPENELSDKTITEIPLVPKYINSV